VAPMRTLSRLSLGLVVFALMANSAAGPRPSASSSSTPLGARTPPFATQSTAFQTTLTKELGEER
jgi:hypothetical protein